jgi:isoamyl acetate esterase
LSCCSEDNTSFKIFPKKSERQNLPNVQLLTIWFGANDACIPGEQQHVPIEKYKENLTKLVRLVKDPQSEFYSPETRIILFTAPPVNTHQWIEELRQRDPPNRRDKLDRDFNVTRQYGEIVKEVGRNEKVPVVDTWALIFKAAGYDERNLSRYLSDGLHLNEESYKVS